jgi:hypothetical protein
MEGETDGNDNSILSVPQYVDRRTDGRVFYGLSHLPRHCDQRKMEAAYAYGFRSVRK